jgi:hypothetical protein
VYVDAPSYARPGRRAVDADAAAQILRLQRAGVPVAVVQRGDDLYEKLAAPRVEARAG